MVFKKLFGPKEEPQRPENAPKEQTVEQEQTARERQPSREEQTVQREETTQWKHTAQREQTQYPPQAEPEQAYNAYTTAKQAQTEPAQTEQAPAEEAPEATPQPWNGEPVAVTIDNSEVLHETERIIDALRKSIANQRNIHGILTQQMQDMQEHNRQLMEQNQQLTDVIRNQHQTIAKFQNDVFYRAQKDVIMEIIRIADEVQTITDGCATDNPMHSELAGLADFIDKGLTFSAVRSFRHADGCSDGFDPKCQEFDSTPVHTDNPAKHGLIVSVRPGYVWTMPWLVANTDVQLQNFMRDNHEPKRFEFVIRPELVARMEYVESEESFSVQSEE